MKVYVVNMKRSVDRRRKMIKRLSRTGIDFEIFEATDGTRFTQSEIDSYLDHERPYFRPLKRGEIGCFLSHYRLMRKIVDENIPAAIVLEDDIIFSKDFARLIPRLQASVRDGDVVMLYVTATSPMNLTAEGSLDSRYSLTSVDDPRALFGTLGYVITRDAAAKISDSLLPINNVIDDWKWYVDHGYIQRMRVLFPFPLELDASYSEIHEANMKSTRFGGIKQFIRNYRIWPFWQFILYTRRRSMHKWGLGNIKLNGAHVDKKFYP